MNFDQAFVRCVNHEGGYTNNPNDPGGETNFGISARAYPGENIKQMTLERAKELYKRDYWGPAGCDAWPEPLKFQVFDFAVNSGVFKAVSTLQAILGVPSDGLIGPQTVQAAQSANIVRIGVRYLGARLRFMASLAIWSTFAKGWSRRIADNLDVFSKEISK
jgi:lysozyme family protein